jgi:hypothetical protein
MIKKMTFEEADERIVNDRDEKCLITEGEFVWRIAVAAEFQKPYEEMTSGKVKKVLMYKYTGRHWLKGIYKSDSTRLLDDEQKEKIVGFYNGLTNEDKVFISDCKKEYISIESMSGPFKTGETITPAMYSDEIDLITAAFQAVKILKKAEEEKKRAEDEKQRVEDDNQRAIRERNAKKMKNFGDSIMFISFLLGLIGSCVQFSLAAKNHDPEDDDSRWNIAANVLLLVFTFVGTCQNVYQLCVQV